MTDAPREAVVASGQSVRTSGVYQPTGRLQVRPGRRLVWAVGGLLAASLLTFFTAWFLVAVFAALVTLAWLAWCDFRELRQEFKQVALSRALPTVVGRDIVFAAIYTLQSQSSRKLEGVLRDVASNDCVPRFAALPFELEPGDSAVLMHTQRIPVRGRHAFGPAWIRIVGPRGLLEGQMAVAAIEYVKVLPEMYASREELLKDIGAEMLLLDKITLSRQHGAGTEFESLTEYRPGDDPRRIDWRTTARYGRPIIRRYQIERHRDVMIIVDCGRLMGADTDRGSKLDCAVDSALLLGRVALQSGDRCGMGLFDNQVRGYLPPVTGLPSMGAIADCVYDAQIAWVESDFSRMFATLQARQAKRSLLVVISDVADVETSEQFRLSLIRLAVRHVVLFAALRTPLLNRIARQPVHTMQAGAEKAVTFRLLHERAQSLQTLRHHGVHVVDVEPHELTLPLVNQFIQLRQRNLL